jgi:hypothetical protein
MSLPRRRESCPNRPHFWLQRIHYAPRNRDDVFSHSHSPRDESASPTGSRDNHCVAAVLNDKYISRMSSFLVLNRRQLRGVRVELIGHFRRYW